MFREKGRRIGNESSSSCIDVNFVYFDPTKQRACQNQSSAEKHFNAALPPPAQRQSRPIA
jgi:hypothetical protein